MDYDLMDKIHIRDLMLRTIIGINPDERVNKQDVVINISAYGDFSQAAETDDFEYAVDYKSLKQAVIAHVEDSSYNLIETMADRVAKLILQRKGVEACRVTVDKPGALRYCRSVAVEVFRR